MELIDRAPLLEMLDEQKFELTKNRGCRQFLYADDGAEYNFLERMQEMLENAPMVEDATPVVHRHWIFEYSDEYGNYYHCSECGYEISLCNEIYTEPTPNYCQNCGAKMDGKT